MGNASHDLTALRDTLLPKLMSGEVRVEEAKGTKQRINSDLQQM